MSFARSLPGTALSSITINFDNLSKKKSHNYFWKDEAAEISVFSQVIHSSDAICNVNVLFFRSLDISDLKKSPLLITSRGPGWEFFTSKLNFRLQYFHNYHFYFLMENVK